MEKKIVVIKTFKNFFIFLAVILAGLTLYPILYPQVRYYFDRFVGKTYAVPLSTALETDVSSLPGKAGLSPFGEMLGGPRPIKIEPINRDFSIVIEKINVNTPIVANVSMAVTEEYKEALKHGVAHAKGSSVPGIGLTYLFAHSSLDFWQLGQYATTFNLIGKLSGGDRIVVFYQGERYDYFVVNKEVVRGWDASPFYRGVSKPTLILQSCTPPGTTLNRLIVTAELENQ